MAKYVDLDAVLALVEPDSRPQLARRITELPVSFEWVGTEDRIPEKSGKYLCIVKSILYSCKNYESILWFEDGVFVENDLATNRVAYWMPLPQEPTQ